MKTKILFQFLLTLLFLLPINSICQEIFYFPIGSRSMAMGNTGYALADDENALFYNPAGLGFRNDRWERGAATYLHENPLLNRYYYNLTYQDNRIPNWGFSGYVNHTSTTIQITDVDMNVIGEEKLWENTTALGTGYNFYSNDIIDNSAGICAKYYMAHGLYTEYSAFVFDAGYLMKLIKRFRIGLVLRNIGIASEYKVDDSTTLKLKLPFNIATGIGYSDFINAGDYRILNIASELSVNSVPNNYGDYFSLNSGMEIGLFKTFFFRFGYCHEFSCNLDYKTLGIGFSIFNHFDLDYFVVNCQTNNYYKSKIFSGFSLSYTRGMCWNSKDLKWWLN